MTKKQRFQRLLDEAGIKNFTAAEAFYLGGSNGRLNLNSEPPESLWENGIQTLKIVQKIRDIVGPIKITSGYRNAAYNKAISGAKSSYHTKFLAFDLIPVKVGVATLHAAAKQVRKDGHFKGGIGRYTTFVHVDTRGYNADW